MSDRSNVPDPDHPRVELKVHKYKWKCPHCHEWNRMSRKTFKLMRKYDFMLHKESCSVCTRTVSIDPVEIPS
jgi:hypothetical protein